MQNEEGGPGDDYTKEIQNYSQTHGGGQLAEVESDNGRLYYLRAQIRITGKK